jgi:toxin FitB
MLGWYERTIGHDAHHGRTRRRALVRRTPSESIWTTIITIFEIHFGLALMAPSRRRDRLQDAFDIAIDEILGGRVLPFDRAAAETAAGIAATQRQVGRPVKIRDVQIAGIAAARKATVATHNTRHFANLGILLVDPWDA